jgi:hypothetical protein
LVSVAGVGGWSSVLVTRKLVVHWGDEEEICPALEIFLAAANDVPRRLTAGYRTLRWSEGRTPAMQTLHGRSHSSGRVLSQEGERQGVPIIIHFSHLDQEIVEPVGEQAELFHFGTGGVEEHPKRQVRLERVDDGVERQEPMQID